MKIFFVLICAVLMMTNLRAQTNTPENNYRAFDSKGNAVKIEQIIDQLANADAVFLGEQHDDPTGHALEAEIFRRAWEKYGKERKVTVSMEMFERDVQTVVDEYLNDTIDEKNFVAASRAWNNYKTDYRPLVEFAKTNKLNLLAANAPRRYVNRISRLGKDSLTILSPEAKTFLAPLPFPSASEAYAKKFGALMGGMPAHNSNLVDAQSLWDATMADSVNKELTRHKNALVIHLNGFFHTENRLGTIDQLLKYNPKARIIVVTMKSTENFPNFNREQDENGGDFVILTDPKLPRTF